MNLDQRLEQLSRVPILLVASDYDGTVAPIVEDPNRAFPRREAVVALRTLADLPQTHVALISGRALRELATLSRMPDEVHLVGSHGSEYDPDFATTIPPSQVELRDKLTGILETIAKGDPGFIVERKPAGAAFHYRNADEQAARNALAEIDRAFAALEGTVYLKDGKMVREFTVLSTNKGDALEMLRHRVGATAVIFFGDDVTDEDAFATMTGPDVPIKVGDGESIAPFRISGPKEVSQTLARLAELRSDWLKGAIAVPIERHSMLSDHRTVAILTNEGRLTWMCAPRIDSSSVFSDLLGGPTAGHFSIRPVDDVNPPTQEYFEDSLVLQTRWSQCTVTDFLDCPADEVCQPAGRSELVRMIEGAGRVRIEFAPRLDFSRVATQFRVLENGLEILDTLEPAVLYAPDLQWELHDEGHHQTAVAEVELEEGRPVVLEFRYGDASMDASEHPPEQRRDAVVSYWSDWAAQLNVPPVQPELVKRSALMIKGLCYGATGALAAAATTSLPEHIGGIRNWDYRFCWLRDAAMSASSLVKLGSMNEACGFLNWLTNVIERSDSPERLHPLYSVSGELLGPEAEITELSGYRGSRPVRVGNAAARQVQLDVFGPIVELIDLMSSRGETISPQLWSIIEAMIDAVSRRWHEPDHGIWEIRKPHRHHVHSKVMCWVTVDRAIDIAQRIDRETPETWRPLRDQIADDVLEHGYKASRNAFTAAYDGEDIDASALFIGLSGLIGADDPRFHGTVEAVEDVLLEGPTVYRYRSDDGLPGYEGGFHICASWLISSYLRIGRISDAWDLFDKMVALVGPTGLMSEQYGPITRRALGNIPQAYSHLGLIDNAIELANYPRN